MAATILHSGKQEWQSDHLFLGLQIEPVIGKKTYHLGPQWDAVTSTEHHCI